MLYTLEAVVRDQEVKRARNLVWECHDADAPRSDILQSN
jgi:hypothetical protein